ncbi:MAG: hypothetical protein JO182_11540 [Acidobacteriaceae bacterium]|nr:hypothetical protein [Acidobacteriaceae bacterium]MBV9305247.1 hypothetical protein [Acidobacteriaceae bacterium]
MTRANHHSAELGPVVVQYERLRQAALGDALPPEARTGLLLFLRRGMWGWARALTTRTALVPSPGSQLPPRKAPESEQTVIHILAAMTMKSIA